MSRIKDFGNHLRDRVQWEDEAYFREAMQMYADAVNEAASGWFPRSFRAWLGSFVGAIFIGAMVMWLLVLATGGLQP